MAHNIFYQSLSINENLSPQSWVKKFRRKYLLVFTTNDNCLRSNNAEYMTASDIL